MLKHLILAAALLTPALASAQVAANRADIIARMSQADANRDGAVTRAELIAWRKSNFARFDRNGDRMLSDADIPAFLRATPIGGQFETLKAQFDTNRDGQVTYDEFVSGPTVMFDLADANRDNVLTRPEIDAAVALAKTAKGR